MVLKLLMVAAAMAVLGWAAPASAHGTVENADIPLAQTIAGTELTVVIRRSWEVPGPLRVDVIAYQPVRDLAVDLRLRSTVDGHATASGVRLERGRAGTYPATLRVAGTGAHELELRAAGEVSVLPFRVLGPRAAGWETVMYGGFGATGVLLAAALVAAAGARMAVATGCGGGALVALAVASTVASLSAALPPATPDGAPPPAAGAADPGRPYAQLAVSTTPPRPAVGDEFTLHLDLSDGSTGQPVDDLAAHHAALAHLVVTSADATFFRHVHPNRTAAGRLAVRLRATVPGRHLVHAEIERADSGGQALAGGFEVAGRAAADGPPAPAAARVALPPEPVPGRPVPIEVDAGAADLQPWLGMAGHLIVRDAAGGFLGHVHEQGGMAAGDGTVAGAGPRLRFAFSFPRPGRYFGWVQFVRDFTVVTVPFTVHIGAERAR
ncbi:hypothetical protein WEI85_39905 [Actinomycetes bacterium KLBMP 9797]